MKTYNVNYIHYIDEALGDYNMKNPIRRKLDEMPFDRLITWVCADGIEREIWIHATGYEFWNGAYWEAEFEYPDGSIG